MTAGRPEPAEASNQRGRDRSDPPFGQFVGNVGTTTNAIPAFANIDPPRMFQLQARFIF